jgi:hypothetical protein
MEAKLDRLVPDISAVRTGRQGLFHSFDVQLGAAVEPDAERNGECRSARP